MKKENIKLAIVGATGLVGETVRKVLEERKLNIAEYDFLASERSEGKEIEFQGKTYKIKKVSKEYFETEKPDYAIFSAGGAVSEKYAPIAAENGCVVIDNSSTFRMVEEVPLVVPEVNPKEIYKNKGIIANPNCSTIQAMLPLRVINNLFGLKRVIYSTYQSVSGAGQKGIVDYENGLKGMKNEKFQYQIASNCIPHIDVFMENGYTKEEMKMIQETRKILGIPDLKVTATTVRVPVRNGHAESINVECEKPVDMELLMKTLRGEEKNGLIVLDDPKNNIYPMQLYTAGKDEVFVGRIRLDESAENALNFWCVADNIRKGAATNAVQILQKILND